MGLCMTDEFETLTEEIREISVPALSVVVDWNDLMGDKGEEEAYRIVGKLKDLLT